MSISRDSQHKRTKTGGRPVYLRKKRKFELGRQPAMTKLGTRSVHLVRGRYGIMKHRALRLETGNFAWASEASACKTRILNVVYNASNNELVRTNTLVRGCVVVIDAAPFRQWYLQHYGVDLSQKKATATKEEAKPAAAEEAKKAEPSDAVKAKHAKRLRGHKLEEALADAFTAGKCLAKVTSRPGQVGRVDGYVLEGEELDFYTKKIEKKKKTK
jgi:small subunit ribosomal protein S8e